MNWLKRKSADRDKSASNDRGLIAAINRVQAVIEFALDGKILNANENFLKTMGYSLEEIRGQHHSMFVEPDYHQTAEYRMFWEKLGRGEFDAGQYKRRGKGGKEVWIQASYNPIFDAKGKPCKVVKFATDITEQKLAQANFEGQMSAISKTQAIIEFALDGTILTANDNFLAAMGYRLAEIRGKHHSMFVESGYGQSPEYRMFWEKLGRGEYDTGKYKRIGKGGQEVWIQASYNPIFDASRKPFKVVKYATDVTAQVRDLQNLQSAARDVSAAVANDDLTIRIPLEGKAGEIADVCKGINALLDSMTNVVTEVMVTASEVASASSEISTSTTDLSQRTEEQAASLEETSASMEEISATVKKNAESANEAKNLAHSAREVADRGGKVVTNAVAAMSRIDESSRKISDIIGVIDEIARQTNLLALNAAVEAARAGDAGRGFAVVASEVRSLAQRSSQAAKDIKNLITNSNNQVGEGVSLVNQAGVSLAEIVEAIKSVADIVTGIAAASTEQSTGIDQVNRALAQMDEVTQQNSALVEENAATAKTLEDQSAAMNDQVSRFKLDKQCERDGKSPQTGLGPKQLIVRARMSVPANVAPISAARRVVGSSRATATAIKKEPD